MVRDSQEREGSRRHAAIASLVAVLALSGGLSGCSPPATPLVIDGFVDGTFSNAAVAPRCLGEVMRGAVAAAGSRGSFSLHTFDGDPLGRRGISVEFSESEVPRSIEGTSKVDDYLSDKARELRSRAESLIETAPQVDGTPLLQVLARAERLQRAGQLEGERHIFLCTDGLFTDIGPDPAAARRLAEEAGLALDGATVDFVGLALSAPGTGEKVEELRPAVEAVLRSAEAELGVWDVELPARWP